MTTSKLQTALFTLSMVLLSFFAFLSMKLWGVKMAYGVVLGGVLMILNLYFLRWTLRKTLSLKSNPLEQGSRYFIATFGIKMLILAGIFSLALWSDRVHALGLFIGCSVVVGAVFILVPIIGFTGLIEEEKHGIRRN